MYLRDGSRKRTALRGNVPKKTPTLAMEPHPFEGYLNHPITRNVLLRLTSGPNGHTPMENIFYSYRNPEATTLHKIKYLPFHKALDYFVDKTRIPRERAIKKVFHHQPTVRTLVNTARSIAVRGLVAPQRFISPLLVVWNITNACNLTCKHCYQNARARRERDELSRAEKLGIVDQLSENYVPMMALAGGEPLTDPDLWAVLERAQQKKVYVTIATNGTLLTRRNVDRIASMGVKYVEVSLDSSDPSTHDEFRGVPGAWARTVEGIQNVVAHPDVRCGMAVCFTRDTVERAAEMLELAVSLKVDTFVHFNFIPVGRGIEMAGEDMLPEQREELLNRLRRFLDEQKMGVMSTAPQFGRTCITHGDPDSMMAMGHAGSGKGRQARVVAKYIGGCGASRCYCSIQPNGLVTPCVYMPSRIIGDLRKSSFAEIWSQPLEAAFSDREDRGDHCGVCDYRSFCGGCRARADGYTGDMLAGDPGCIYNRHMWDEITDLQENEPEILYTLAASAEIESREEIGREVLT